MHKWILVNVLMAYARVSTIFLTQSEQAYKKINDVLYILKPELNFAINYDDKNGIYYGQQGYVRFHSLRERVRSLHTIFNVVS